MDASPEDASSHDAARRDASVDSAIGKDATSDASTDTGTTTADAAHDASGDASIDAGASSYPTAHLGVNPRAGSVPGDVIRNYGFSGYRASPGGVLDTSQLRTIHLADFYDPNGKKGLKVLHIIAAARWSAPDSAELQAAVSATSSLAANGGVFLVVLGQGATVGANASKGDLDAWVTAYAPHFTMALDPGFASLSEMWDVSAVPFNVDVDLRSMEILAAGVGAPANLAAEVQSHIQWVSTHAPSWP